MNFKYNDVVKVKVTPGVIGELIDIRPKYLKDGVPVYTFIMHNIKKGFLEVRPIDIIKLTEEELKETWYGKQYE